MINADPPMPLDGIRANIKVIIGGGLNEPRDAILTLVLGLLENPAQKDNVLARPELWPAALEEAVRWISPIGMSPRRIAKPWSIRDVAFETDERAFLMFGSANRDEAHFARADEFDVRRDTSKSVAFGAGPHFCAGAFASRAMIGKIVAPMLFERLRNLRLREDAPPVVRGWVFRGPVSLPVRWDA